MIRNDRYVLIIADYVKGVKLYSIIKHGKRKLYELFINWGASIFNIKTMRKDMMVKLFCV